MAKGLKLVFFGVDILEPCVDLRAIRNRLQVGATLIDGDILAVEGASGQLALYLQDIEGPDALSVLEGMNLLLPRGTSRRSSQFQIADAVLLGPRGFQFGILDGYERELVIVADEERPVLVVLVAQPYPLVLVVNEAALPTACPGYTIPPGTSSVP